MATSIFTPDDQALILLNVETAMKQTSRTDRADAVSHPSRRIEARFDEHRRPNSLEISPTAGYSDLPVDYQI
jgi:hypothetical protein